MGEDIGSKYLVHLVFGTDLGDAMAIAEGSREKPNYRAILEATSPVIQCERAGHPFKNDGTDQCYICGLTIPIKGGDQANELYPECEHILPVGQARAFLEIYSHIKDPNSKFSQASIAWYETAIRLEYAQSHRVCNQAKRQGSFIGYPEFWETNLNFDERETRRILTAIRDRATAALAKETNQRYRSILKAIADTVQSRTQQIKQIVDGITDHINRHNPDEGSLLLLARISTLADPTKLPAKARNVYDNWRFGYQNESEINDAIETMITRTPNLDPASILETFTPSLDITSILTEGEIGMFRQFILDFYKHYFNEIEKIPKDESGLRLIESVGYAMHRGLLENIPLERFPDEIRCRLVYTVSTIETKYESDPILTILLKYFDNQLASPNYTELLRQCNQLFESKRSSEERAERASRGEYVEQVGKEDYANFLYDEGLKEYLYQKLVTYNLGETDARQVVEFIHDAGKSEFLQTYDPSDPIRSAIDSARKTCVDVSTAIALRFSDQGAQSEEIANTIYNDIIDYWNSKESIEQNEYKGGLRRRFHFKQNARISHLGNLRSAKHSRLRKRTRKGRTYRLRQRSSKPKTRRQRKSLGGVRLA